MKRVPEAELMLDPAQALAYARADFAEPHDRCVALLTAKLPSLPVRGRALDLGCGPGDVTLRLAHRLAEWSIDALDGSPAMIALAREAAVAGAVDMRVRFIDAVLPANPPPPADYDLVFSNSLLHHLADPAVLWDVVRRSARRDAAVFVMDLLRPADEDEARALVRRYAADEPAVLQTDFFNSLRAAYRPDEVRSQLAAAELGNLSIEVVSDRHLIVWGTVMEIPAVPK